MQPDVLGLFSLLQDTTILQEYGHEGLLYELCA